MQVFCFTLKNEKRKLYDRFAILISILSCAGISITLFYSNYSGFWWIAALTILLLFLYKVAQRKLAVIITREKISYPSFPVRTIQWTELNSIILKDGLLTIDFKNNRLIQHYPDKSQLVPDEKEFNEFCKEQLKG